jgi:hypothetical protein
LWVTRLDLASVLALAAAGSWHGYLDAWSSAAGYLKDLLVLFPGICELGLHDLVGQAGYPSTRALSSWQSIGALLLAKCARKARVHHVGSLTDDEGLAFALGLTALPKATHLGTYSWRVRRDCNQKLLSGLVSALRPLGLATGQDGFNCDFHSIRRPLKVPACQPGPGGRDLRLLLRSVTTSRALDALPIRRCPARLLMAGSPASTAPERKICAPVCQVAPERPGVTISACQVR